MTNLVSISTCNSSLWHKWSKVRRLAPALASTRCQSARRRMRLPWEQLRVLVPELSVRWAALEQGSCLARSRRQLEASLMELPLLREAYLVLLRTSQARRTLSQQDLAKWEPWVECLDLEELSSECQPRSLAQPLSVAAALSSARPLSLAALAHYSELHRLAPVVYLLAHHLPALQPQTTRTTSRLILPQSSVPPSPTNRSKCRPQKRRCSRCSKSSRTRRRLVPRAS